MRNRITIIIFLMLCFFTNNAQSLKGLVTDGESHEPIPYASIVLNDLEGNFLEGVSTNDEGLYLLEYKNGTYNLVLSFMGYETINKEITIDGNQGLDFNMKNTITNLDEITVTAERTTVQQMIDKKVINVGSDILSSGGDASTVLSQLSEIDADENGRVSLRGNENVSILVNGKPSPLDNEELLQQISSNEISQIEIITSPSAKYQASGLTGIINIITNKKVRKGLSITTNANVNTLGGYNPKISFQYGQSKVNVKLGGGYSKRIYKTNRILMRSGTESFTQFTDYGYDGNIYSINGGLDWFISENDEFSISTNYRDNGHDLTNISSINQNNNEIKQDRFNSHSHITLNTNANYRHYFNEKKSFLELDAQISDNSNILKSDFRPNLEVLDNHLNNNVLISNVALDYSNNINDKLKIETGLLWNRQTLSNEKNQFDENNEIFVIDKFENTKSTYALYGMVNYKINKLTIQTGLRGEHYQRDAHLISEETKVSNTFNNLFPSLHLKYGINKKQSLSLGYNRRTSRPSLGQVNPNPFQSNEFSVNQGNPSLEPEFSNNIELSYQYKIEIISFSPEVSYRKKNQVITPYQFINEAGLTERTYLNNGNSDAIGFGLTANLNFPKWLKTDFSYNWFYEKFREDQLDFERNYSKNSRLTLKNTFTFSKKTNLVTTWRYSFRNESFNSNTKVNQNIDIAIRQKILKNKGSISLRVTDIFNTRVWDGETIGEDFTQKFRNKPKSRVAHLAFSYTFDGGEKLKNRNKKSRKYESGVVH